MGMPIYHRRGEMSWGGGSKKEHPIHVIKNKRESRPCVFSTYFACIVHYIWLFRFPSCFMFCILIAFCAEFGFVVIYSNHSNLLSIHHLKKHQVSETPDTHTFLEVVLCL